MCAASYSVASRFTAGGRAARGNRLAGLSNLKRLSTWQPLHQRRRAQQHQCCDSRAALDAAAQAADASDMPASTSGGGLAELELPAPAAQQQQLSMATAARALDAFYRFTRPHTMAGTFISVCSVSALAAGALITSPPALAALAQALVSALLMNVCIVGINQLYDIEIDRVNKPYLPLAAGDFSIATGVALVAATGAASLAIALASGSTPLLATVGGSLALGVAYSTDLPLLRWKRSPVLAAACILAVRAVLVQLGFYAHMLRALGADAGGLPLSRPILFATGLMLVFSVVIALFKDIPDVVGDKRAGLRTLSVRLGPPRVFWLCIALLELGFAGAIAVGLASQHWWCRLAVGVSHAAMGVALFRRAQRTDLTSPADIYKTYMYSWRLFYCEYLLLPLFSA